ncbi:MAG TPA: NHL repeat-containing protein [Acidobacteriaceae bacterium]
MVSYSSRFLTSVIASIFSVGMLCGTVGCGSSVEAVSVVQPPPGVYSGVGIGGKAMAGKQPLIGASVQVYAAGTGGNGSAGSSLLSGALTTDANGAFNVPAGYSCPTGSSQIYVVARGGKAGAAGASNNATVLMTAVGACNQVVASSQIEVNEATTVAAAYALSQFLSVGGNMGASATNVVGLANAAATALALANISDGTIPGITFVTNAVSPVARMDSIANMLNACVASTATGSACTSLFVATTPTGGSAPTNTLDAVLNLVHHPAANVANLYTLSGGSTAFSPVLAAAPSDWTLFVNYTGGGMNAPSGVGVDSAGNVWVANYFNVASMFSPLGKPLFAQGITGFGLGAAYGLAVDASDHAWIPNEPSTGVKGNSVTVLTSSGLSVSGMGGFTSGGLDFPISVAIDTDGSAWVVDYGNSHLTHLSGSGQALSGASGYTSTLFAFPVAAAVDASHNVWVVNQSGGSVTKVSPDGSQFTNYSCCNGPSNLAFDQRSNLWLTNYYGDSISEISSSGAVVSSGGYVNGGLSHPQGIAIDGAGTVWIANYRSPAITELAGAGATVPGAALSPAGGLGADAALLEAYAIAVDASGNLWVSNFGSNVLTEFVGMASPVKTPQIGLPAAP